ncbi:glycoside hydrolase domain-containing protein [Marinobacterium rhizophilum]|uniref:glycoside hydrolase domain-containing protein n=1 Tax=Marinobacterium rhizophilum TaxID=420402 RepID=UPI000382A7E8|nr:glycoside hydrolase domain-containing protein [Marinobacterium rhizophilum]
MTFKEQFEESTGWNTVDTNRRLTASGGEEFIEFLKENRVQTVIRYYASTRRAKTISPDEAKLISREGFAILPVYQDNNRTASDFGEQNGVKSTNRAVEFANLIGQPDGSTILFAVDQDFTADIVDSHIVPYFKGIKSELVRLGRHFRIGVYGSGHVCRTLMNKGLVQVSWLSMSRGFTGTKDFFFSSDWMLRQIPLDKKHPSGFSYDRNLMRVPQSEIGAFVVDEQDRGTIVGGSIDPPGSEPEPLTGTVPFPGHTISTESGDEPSLIQVIQRRLIEVGYGPLTVDGDFGSMTRNVVRDFQAENDDLNGEALEVDGKVGQLSWEALFATDGIEAPVPDVSDVSDLGQAFLEICLSQEGVKEDRPFKNRGPRIDSYIRATGLKPFAGNFAWCVAYMYWCAVKLCEQKNVDNPVPRTAGVHRLWQLGQSTALTVVDDDEANPGTVRPGMMFFIDKGNGQGHAGVVIAVEGDRIKTIEGNTNGGGVREGHGVFVRSRKIQMSSLLGYLDFWREE